MTVRAVVLCEEGIYDVGKLILGKIQPGHKNSDKGDDQCELWFPSKLVLACVQNFFVFTIWNHFEFTMCSMTT